MMRRARPLLGTLVEIEADGIAQAALEQAMTSAFAAVALVHRLMSFHEPDSDLTRLNRAAAAGAVAVHPWTAAVLRRARAIFHATDGLFDCAVGRDLARLGLLPAHDFGKDFGPGEAGDFSAVCFLPGNRFAFTARIALDLGGLAKGFAVDRAIAVLRAHGVREALVNAGGDMRVMGSTAQPIYIRHPTEPAQLLFAGTLQNGAIATSSPTATLNIVDGRKASVLLSAPTRTPIVERLSYSVVAPTCIVADALTKVLAQVGRTDAPSFSRFGASAIMFPASATDQKVA
jgi:thiamine biosynthesis lipoprotein